MRVLELGSRKGNSTLAFLTAAEETGGHVWSSDIADVRRLPDGIGPFGMSPRWTFVHGDDMNPDVQAQLPAQVDVLFIDTWHEYEHTLGELAAFMPRVAPGGVALFHDTNLIGWPGYAVGPARPPGAGRAGRLVRRSRALLGEPPGRIRARGDPAVRCPGCGYLPPR